MATVRVQRDVSGDAIRCPRLQGATNAYAGEIPAYSLVKPTAVTGDLVTITRPTADDMGNIMATGPAKIAQGTKGLCSGNWPLPVQYAGAAPAIGDIRGTAADSFLLTTGKKGFRVIAVDAGVGLAWIVPTASTEGGGGVPSPAAQWWMNRGPISNTTCTWHSETFWNVLPISAYTVTVAGAYEFHADLGMGMGAAPVRFAICDVSSAAGQVDGAELSNVFALWEVYENNAHVGGEYDCEISAVLQPCFNCDNNHDTFTLLAGTRCAFFGHFIGTT